MSADPAAEHDEPVPFVLTPKGEAAAVVRCRECGREFTTFGTLMAHRYNAQVHAPRPRVKRGRLGAHVSAAPLLELVEGRGGFAACGGRQHSAGERAYYRARRDGWLTERAADLLAVTLLGLTTWEVWGG